MAFTLVRPSPVARTVDWSKTASTAYTIDSLVQPDDDATGVGFDLVVAASTAVLGSIIQTIASTDGDYASTTRLNLQVDELGEWEATANATTPTADYEGRFVDLSATTPSLNVNPGLTTTKMFLIQRFISATALRGFIVKWATNGYTAIS